jgi:hypothetical protein
MPAHFFRRHWELYGDEVTVVVLRVLRGEDDPSIFNNTSIVLIPKVVMANRLKKVLPDLISDEQSAFVPGRSITDNIITAYECMHFMKKKRARDSRFAALKLDMRKAYDRVEWSYLQAIMIRLVFHRLWVDTIMRLVTSVSFSVFFNAERHERFVPSRGIRQGIQSHPICSC